MMPAAAAPAVARRWPRSSGSPTTRHRRRRRRAARRARGRQRPRRAGPRRRAPRPARLGARAPRPRRAGRRDGADVRRQPGGLGDRPEQDDFATLAPALRRNVELARAYAACFDDHAGPYDALLADYDFGLTAARIEAVFGRLAEALPPMLAGARPAEGERPSPSAEAQRKAVPAVLARLGVDRAAGASTSPRTRSAPASAISTAASPPATRRATCSPCWPPCTSACGKERKMILDEDAEFSDRVVNLLQLRFETFEHATETVVLDQKQQFLFRSTVMIETGQADIRRTRNVAHRRRVITLLGEDARSGAQYEFKLLIVSGWLYLHFC